ncbi:MAG TPA: hypothetical protein PLA94_16100 [Myxococcota bacterium]|nr:hypothetical protein [Myxococcota bacterium]HND31526.1 hypothetical protein [Myxococcota bacterium]
MFDLSLGELMMIAVLAIVFIGPDDLPKMMRIAGRYYAKIRRASDDLRRAFNAEVAKVEAEERREEMRRRREEMERRRAELQAKAQEKAVDPTQINADVPVVPPAAPGASTEADPAVPRLARHLPAADSIPAHTEDGRLLPEPPPAEPNPQLLPPDPRLPDDAAPRILPTES